jgi:hypothetical protein
MVVVGTHDRLTPPGGAERIAGGIKEAELVRISGAGHMSMLERPDSFNAALRAFLARVGSRPRAFRGSGGGEASAASGPPAEEG